MNSQLKIIIATGIVSLGVFLLAIFWPKITKQKPPEPIKKIREEVKGTKVGGEILNVLGESKDEKKDNKKTPVDSLLDNASNIVTNTTNNITERIKEEITKIILERTSEEIVKKLNELPGKEKEEVKKEFCK